MFIGFSLISLLLTHLQQDVREWKAFPLSCSFWLSGQPRIMRFGLPSSTSCRGSLQYYRDRVTLAETITHTYTVTSVERLAGLWLLLLWEFMCMHCKILFYYFLGCCLLCLTPGSHACICFEMRLWHLTEEMRERERGNKSCWFTAKNRLLAKAASWSLIVFVCVIYVFNRVCSVNRSADLSPCMYCLRHPYYCKMEHQIKLTSCKHESLTLRRV